MDKILKKNAKIDQLSEELWHFDCPQYIDFNDLSDLNEYEKSPNYFGLYIFNFDSAFAVYSLTN